MSGNNQYQSLLQAVEGIVWEADAESLQFSFVSNKAAHILGYTPEDWLSDPDFWKNHIYPEDREYATNFYRSQTSTSISHSFDYRMIKADGSIAWIKDLVSMISENGRQWLCGIMVDITEPKLLANLDHLEKEILELNARKDTDIETVLNAYVQGIEGLFHQMKCSILRVRNNRLFSWASQSLPAAYVQSINNLEIGPEAGSCGTAAFLKKTVIVSDIAKDVKWAAYKDLALPYGLRACWSYPVENAEGHVIAVFGVYYDTIKTPDDDQLAIIERTAAILKVILENRLYAEMVRETSMLATQGQELANFGSWQWDIVNNKVSWSGVLYRIYGLDEKTFKATFEGYLEMLHPDDRERIRTIIQEVLETHNDITFEERIIRPGGEVRHLKSWGRVLLNETGRPIKMIGACLDITKARTTETKMQEIAWLQSHVIRAPLARLMGLVALLKEDVVANAQQDELLNHIMTTANELDEVIRDISSKTENNIALDTVEQSSN